MARAKNARDTPDVENECFFCLFGLFLSWFIVATNCKDACENFPNLCHGCRCFLLSPKCLCDKKKKKTFARRARIGKPSVRFGLKSSLTDVERVHMRAAGFQEEDAEVRL